MASISKKNVIKIIVGKRQNQYQTIQAAIDAATTHFPEQIVEIMILPGHYQERLHIWRNHLKLIGWGTVLIEASLSARQQSADGREYGTFRTATCFIDGSDIQLINLQISNTAGADHLVGQAVAVYCEGDQVTFDHCRLTGHQDTLCLGPLPVVQKDGTPFVTDPIKTIFPVQNYHFNYCEIQGTIDFIFGGGNAWFSHCTLTMLERINHQAGFITAASTAPTAIGFIFTQCWIQAEGQQPYFLGRPWREYAKTQFIDCGFDEYLVPAGWHDWDKISNHQTVMYSEQHCFYQNLREERPDWVRISH
ncbi:pectinesterase family protein [Lapidilactobacillus luobeiensis]|uniref:pectinesterase family protein n=1 Tax=Lapidilactobacillus luobeiensis TaxID=2950371 RepID=UPI0021C2CC2D|nr:pectinesterase family protein [Lapidilactobacillus luobeiensis]